MSWLFSKKKDEKTEEIKEMEEELHSIFGYSKEKLSKMSASEIEECWYEEDAEKD